MTFVIKSDPVPSARPRFSRGHAYQPKRNRAYRQVVQSAARAAMQGKEILSGALSVSIKLYRRYRPTARNYGDVDNHAKAIFDGLNGICFTDDSQVTDCRIEKFTDKKNPRAEVEISAAEFA